MLLPQTPAQRSLYLTHSPVSHPSPQICSATIEKALGLRRWPLQGYDRWSGARSARFWNARYVFVSWAENLYGRRVIHISSEAWIGQWLIPQNWSPKLIPKIDPKGGTLYIFPKSRILSYHGWWFWGKKSSNVFHRKMFIKNFASKNFPLTFSSTFSSTFFISKFSLRLFFRICFPIAGQEFSPGSNGGTPRLQIGLGKKIQTIFDSRLSSEGESSVGQLK